MFRLFSFDIDDTLFDNRTKTYPEDAMEALRCLKRRGYIVTIATGRHPWRAVEVLSDGVPVDYIICNNGHCLLDKEGKVVSTKTVSAEVCTKATEFCRERGMGLCWSYPEQSSIYFLDECMDYIVKKNGLEHFFFPSTDYHLQRLPNGGCVSGSKKDRDELEALVDYAFRIVPINDRYGDLTLKDCSKWHGLEELCRTLSISPAECMAFGDNWNDSEILQGCGVGVCMGNGTEELKRVADYVTSDIADGGIWKALQHYGVL